MDPKPLPVVAYLRSNSTYDHSLHAIDRQALILRENAAKFNLCIVAEYREIRGGMGHDLPEFDRAVRDAAKRKVEMLIADPSRLGRNPVYVSMRLAQLREAGVVVRLANGQVMDALVVQPFFDMSDADKQARLDEMESDVQKRLKGREIQRAKRKRARLQHPASAD